MGLYIQTEENTLPPTQLGYCCGGVVGTSLLALVCWWFMVVRFHLVVVLVAVAVALLILRGIVMV